MNSSVDEHNRTGNRTAEEELGKTGALSHHEGEDTFDVLQGEDDINKYHKLVKAFEDKFKENNAFTDTFIDPEVFRKTMNSEDYLRVSVDLLKYIMHTSFNAKKPVDKKKPGGGMFGGSSKL